MNAPAEELAPQEAADVLAVPLSFLSALVELGALTPHADGMFDRTAVVSHKTFVDAVCAGACEDAASAIPLTPELAERIAQLTNGVPVDLDAAIDGDVDL